MSGRAVVVGAGVGGLATAVGLRRAGWEVSVLERRAETERYGTAFGVSPHAQRALERLGVGAVLHRRAVPYRAARIRSPAGITLAHLPLERVERREGRPELLLFQPYLVDALLAELDAYGDVRLTFDEQVSTPSRLAAEHDLVVGADGINSAVRGSFFGGRSQPRHLGTVAWTGIADIEPGVYGQTWGRGRFFGMTPVEPGRTHWYAVVPQAETVEAPEELRAYFDGWHDPVPRLLAQTDPTTWLRYDTRHLHPALPTFVSREGVALVGDAAHAMPPHLGQGAGTALLDAEALARAVTGRHQGELPSALRAYDTERRRRSQRVAFASRQLHRFMSTSHTGVRNGLLRLLPTG